jgi:N-acetylmuramoyl-L-alanine amidase
MAQIIPESWMPDCDGKIKRLIVHWTAGGRAPSEVDREHYHVLISSDGKPHRGDRSIRDNMDCTDDVYAAHTAGCNTGSIGLACCGMAGAVRRPFKPGPYPITKTAWQACLFAAADLCRAYDIPADKKHLLMHCEVEAYLSCKQSGKWDIECLPFDRGDWSSVSPGEELRRRVAALLRSA